MKAIDDNDIWPHILPSLNSVDRADLAPVINVDTTLDPVLVDRVLTHARELHLAASVVPLVLAFDDRHVEALKDSKVLADVGVQDWLLAEGGVSERLVRAVLVDLGLRPG